MHKKEQCIQCWQLPTTAQTVPCVMCHSVNTSELAQLFQQSSVQKQRFTFIIPMAQYNSWVQLDSFTMQQQRLL